MKNCLFLYNPISGHGHLDSWHAIFASLLAKRGYAVICLTTDPDGLRRHLPHLDEPMRKAIVIRHVSSRQQGLEYTLRSKILQYIHWWRRFSDRYVMRRLESQISDSMSVFTKIKKKLFQCIVPRIFYVIGDFSRLSSMLEPHYYLHKFYNHVHAAIKETRINPGIVLHMYLDCENHAQSLIKPFPFKWTGIRFVPSLSASEPCYTMPSFLGMALCDEQATAVHMAKYPNKQFVTLPDITNAALPDATPPLVDKILQAAANRKIVFMGGSIGKQKNVSAWKACIDLMDPKEWFFVQIGEIHVETLDQASNEAMHSLLTSPPPNFFAYTKYLPDEMHFNAVINASDIIFAVYKDFTISSNMPGKAAAFNKPSLVSTGYVMEHRVARYGIGIAVPQDDVEAMIAALESLRDHPISSSSFAAYRSDYSYEKLEASLDNFLKSSLTCCRPG